MHNPRGYLEGQLDLACLAAHAYLRAARPRILCLRQDLSTLWVLMEWLSEEETNDPKIAHDLQK